MPKNTLKIQSFHGGLNSNSDPRDITENESPSIYDVNIDKVGKIITCGSVETITVDESAAHSRTLPNYGLFTMDSDKQLDGGDNNERLIFLYNHNDRNINAKDSEGWDEDVISFSNVIKPVFFSADGTLRVADADFTRDSRWFGYIDYQPFDGLKGDLFSGSDPGWTDTTQKIASPTKGKFLISQMKKGDDTDGVLSSESEYIDGGGSGFLSGEGIDKVLELTSVNMRLGFQLNTLGGVVVAAYNETGCSASGAPDVDNTDVAGAPFKLLGGLSSSSNSDHSVFVTGSGSTSASELEITSSSTPRYPSDTLSTCFGFYIENTAAGYGSGSNIEYLVRMGSDASNYYEWLITHEEIVPDCWNILVAESGNISSVVGSPPDLDGKTAAYHRIIMDKNTASGDAPDFWTGGFFTTENPGVQGYGPGTYTFHYSWLYDREKQESLPFEFKGVQDGATAANIKNVNKIAIHKGSLLFKYDFYILPGSDATTYGISKRITGARTYFKVEENNDYFLIGELDFINKGFKWVPESNSMDIAMSNTADNSGILSAGRAMIVKQISPLSANTVDTYRNINGFSTKVESIYAQYKTAVVQGRRVYVGNIKQDGETHPDRILKSQINKFDVFPEGMSNIDVAIRDGESVIKLMAFADRILQFKEKSLYIINVSENIDFLEDTYRNKGCLYHYHVVETDYGIAWFNKYGVYFYDGKQVLNLLEKNNIKIINETDWFSFLKGSFTNSCTYNNDPTITNTDVNGKIKVGLSVSGTGIPANSTVSEISTTDPDTEFELSASTTGGSVSGGSLTFTDENTEHCHIGYSPKHRQLIIKNINGDIYIYDFVLKSWSRALSKMTFTRSTTNFALDENENLFYYSDASTSAGSLVDVEHKYWSNSSSIASNFEYKTKDIDFGEPGVRKKIYKVYVSYKGDGSAVTANYSINGDTDTISPFYRTQSDGSSDKSNSDTTPLLNVGTDDWVLAELKPVSSINNIYSFQLILGGTAAADFEINDITVVYRMKSIR
jgi:hypothetical protein